MNRTTFFTTAFALLLSASIATPSWADKNSSKGKHNPDLGGLIFAIEGEFLYDPLGIGAPFVNCYTFEEDTAPDDDIISGVWLDPLFPAPGTWVQHAGGGKIRYTALADDGGGFSLSQNGIVKGKGKKHLEAYTVVSVAGLGIIAEILSVGEAVDYCPYDL